MTWVTVNGGRVFTREVEGGGLPVVLLHMAGGGASTWGPVANLLGRRARVLVPDLPGHGQSDGVALPGAGTYQREGIRPSLASMAAWVVEFLDALEIPRAFLAGHSMGGCVAMAAALGAPSRVAGLGLVCTSADLELPAAMRDALHQRYDAFLAQFIPAATPHRATSGTLAGARPVFPQAERARVQADFDAVDGFHVLGALRETRVPAGVVAGGLDVITPPVHGEALAAALRAPFTLVPSGGHLLPREQPATVSAALLDAHQRASG